MNERFESVELNEEGKREIAEITRLFTELGEHLRKANNFRLSRCISQTLIKLEEACFYAKKSISLNEKYQK